VRAVVVWGDRHFDSARTVCLIHPDNLRSVHVAEKCGYKEFELTTYKGQPALIFER
jgi:RimJ/RimL family protein N-acetyltransferase